MTSVLRGAQRPAAQAAGLGIDLLERGIGVAGRAMVVLVATMPAMRRGPTSSRISSSASKDKIRRDLHEDGFRAAGFS